jgi:hypothetical protein
MSFPDSIIEKVPPPYICFETRYNLTKNRVEAMTTLNYNNQEICSAVYYPNEGVHTEALVVMLKSLIKHIEDLDDVPEAT